MKPLKKKTKSYTITIYPDGDFIVVENKFSLEEKIKNIIRKFNNV